MRSLQPERRGATAPTSVNVEARITPVWKKRMLLLIAFVLASGGWFFYDGYIGWPAEAKRHATYAEFVDGLVERGEISREIADTPHNKSLEEAWRDHAREHGLSTSVPSERTEEDFRQQKIIGAGAVAVAVAMFWWFVLSCRRVLRADDSTIYAVDGKHVPLDSVVGVNKKRWDSKGIAVVYYSTGDGKRAKAVLDDYKYGGAEEILDEVERRLAAKNPG